MRIQTIRNFSIIAHIDHGKSTLADRLLEHTNTVSTRQLKAQTLDDMDLERERGITIKARAVVMAHEHAGTTYALNLIDTPGHVDFNYEVSRSLTACEGALLLVDAAQGVEAQTLANFYLALERNLVMIPVVNKIDLPAARPEEVAEEIERILDIPAKEVIFTSAKTGHGIEEVIHAVINRIPPPSGDPNGRLQALIFDAVYDDYRGVIIFVRVMNGSIRRGKKIRMAHTGMVYDTSDVGLFRPTMTPTKSLSAGEVGYVVAAIKKLEHVKIGDTLLEHDETEDLALPGYKEPLPMVFCGFYPADNSQYHELRQALEKLKLNDDALVFQPESSNALGLGFRCGFLGLLHMEIAHERLEREYQLALIKTAPTVTYEILNTKGEISHIDNPVHLPTPDKIDELREPIVRVNFIIPAKAMGDVLGLCENRRGIYKSTEYLSPVRVSLTYELPLSEIVYDFYDNLKSLTRGYGTMDYTYVGHRPADLVKLDILVSGSPVDALSSIIHKDQAATRGRQLVRKLQKTIARHLFEIPLQAAIGGKIIARETIRAMSKNVTAKCYGGDITRKRKLIEKQKAGKKRMKHIGNVEIPQEAFTAILAVDRDD